MRREEENILMIKNCDIKLLGEMHFHLAQEKNYVCLWIVLEFRYALLTSVL